MGVSTGVGEKYSVDRGETYCEDRGRRHTVDTGYKCDQCRYRV